MTDTQADQAREIAAKLTKGEHTALRGAVEHDGGWRIPVYVGRKSNGHRARVSLPTLRSLTSKGIADMHPPRLTPLGLAVRQILQEGSPA